MNYKIALIRGDGIGPEVVGEAVKVLDTVGENPPTRDVGSENQMGD